MKPEVELTAVGSAAGGHTESKAEGAPGAANSADADSALGMIREGLRPFHARYIGQVKALMVKNFIQAKRHWKSTLAQLLAPMMFVVFMSLIDVALQSSGAEDRAPEPFFSMGPAEYANSQQGAGDVPPCRVFDTSEGRYGQGGVMPSAWCTSLVYAPASDALAKEVMDVVADSRGWTAAPTVWGDPSQPMGSDVDGVEHDIVGLASEDDLRDYIRAFPGRVGAAVVFNTTNNGKHIDYQVWYNNSAVGRFYSISARLDALWESTNGFMGSYSLRVERAVNEALLTVLTGVESAELAVSMRRFPEVQSESSAPGAAVSTFGPMFIFLAVMFSFVTALQQMVNEKETNLVAAMRTAGLYESAIWLTYTLHNAVVYLVSSILMIIMGIILDLDFFVNTNFFVLLVIFEVYSLAMLGIAFSLAAVIPRVKIANYVGFGIFALGMILQIFGTIGMSTFWFDDGVFSQDAQNALQLFPPIGFGKAFSDIAFVTSSSSEWDYVAREEVIVPGDPFEWSNLYNGTYAHEEYFSLEADGSTYTVPSTADTLGFMVAVYFIFTVIAWYLSQVFPGAHGRPQVPWFLFDPRYWGLLKPKQQGDFASTGISVRNLRKRYGKFTAVDGVSFDCQRGKVFALLGHNGAGKSTCLNQMIGLTAPTSGDVTIEGYSVNTQVDSARQMLGVCPQHDILWESLTPVETLDFFASFRGVPADLRTRLIEESLHHVKLSDVKHKQAGTFSGGMKRRLSVAVALVGQPAVVTLDEPTTGMDPMNRRSVWDMIEVVKRGRVVILTTHAMEEAEALGDEIAIMSHGKVVASGSSLELKAKYGAGYQVKLVCKGAEAEGLVKQKVVDIVPGAKLIDSSAGNMTYSVAPRQLERMPALFRWIESLPQNGDGALLEDWGISHTTLEEVFLKLAHAGTTDVDAVRNVSMRSLSPTNASASRRNLETKQVAEAGSNGAAAPNGSAKGKGPARQDSFDVNRVGEAKGDVVAPWVIDPSGSAAAPQPSLKASSAKDQIRALIRKTWHVQKEAKRTNCCQICCPVVLLLLLFVLQVAVFDPLKVTIAENQEQERLEALGRCDDCRDPGGRMYTECIENNQWCDNIHRPEDDPNWQLPTECEPDYCDTIILDEEAVLEWCWECSEYESRYSKNTVQPDVAWSDRASGDWVMMDSTRSGGDWVTHVVVSGDEDVGELPAGVVEIGGESAYTWVDNERVPNTARVAELTQATAANGTGVLAQYPVSLLDWFPRWEPGSDVREPNRILAAPAFKNVGTREAADQAMWAAQETARVSDVYPWDTTDAVRDVNEMFPLLGADFEVVDTSAARLHVTLQHFFSWSVGFGGGYPFVSLLQEQNPLLMGGDKEPGGDEELEGLNRVLPVSAQSFVEWQSGAVTAEATAIHSMLTGLTTAFVRSSTGDQDITIRSGITTLPFVAEEGTFDVEVILNGIINLLLPLGTSILVPVFVLLLVSEKELRLRAMMISQGMQERYYFFAVWSFAVILSVLQTLVFFVFGVAFGIRFFTRSSAILIVGLMLMWNLASISFSFFLSAFFSKTRPATIVTYFGLLLGVISSNIANQIAWQTGDASPFWMMWPPFAYYRGIYMLSQRSYVLDDVTADDDIIRSIWWLVILAVAYFVLFLYFDRVLPTTFGVPESPIFCLKAANRYCRNRRAVNTVVKGEVPDGVDLLDSDVAAEYRRVANGTLSDDAQPIQIINLRKVYGTKVAVDNLSLAINQGECFSLLGPNGAGKTTAISVVTGLYPPSAGTARVVGFDIRTDLAAVEQNMGITPQFDVCWPRLSVRQHLQFYAAIKGIAPSEEADVVSRAAIAVGLGGQWLDTASGDLSGGMRRRLSLAMSLIGRPRVLFLDEPSTGLDPETRRSMWRLIEDAKAGRSLVLTTHAMDEADALSDRIGIMALGTLRCVGTALHLKNKFGSGFKIDLSYSPPERLGDVTAFIKSVVPAAELTEDYMGSCTFAVQREDIRVSTLFERMMSRPGDIGITQWGLRGSSLEEVFLKIALASEAAEAAAHGPAAV